MELEKAKATKSVTEQKLIDALEAYIQKNKPRQAGSTLPKESQEIASKAGSSSVAAGQNDGCHMVPSKNRR